jgi:hypothetical protein
MKLHARRRAVTKTQLGEPSARIHNPYRYAELNRLPSARRLASTGTMGELPVKSAQIRADSPADETIPLTKHRTGRHRIKGGPDNAWTIRF